MIFELRVLMCAAATVVAGAAAGLGLTHSGEASPVPVHHRVEIRGFAFHPTELVVAPGDTITWTNHDLVPHTASAIAATWDSGEMEPGQSWQWIVPPGGTTERYLCLYHPTMVAALRAR